jgi:hypothetical protein
MGQMSYIYSRKPFLMERPLFLVQERSQRSQHLRRFLSHLIAMFRPDEPLIKSRPKIPGVIDPLEWLPEELN